MKRSLSNVAHSSSNASAHGERKSVGEICTVAVEDDGMVFDAKTVKAARIKEDAEYEGVRITLTAALGTALAMSPRP